MKRLIVLALLAAALWYGWKHYPELLHKEEMNVAVIENRAERGLTRVRLTVGDQTFVRENIPAGQSADIPFKVQRDGEFKLTWQWQGREGEPSWSGGIATHGPIHSRHFFTVDDEGGVVWRQELKQ